jgi:hypothetical protein
MHAESAVTPGHRFFDEPVAYLALAFSMARILELRFQKA